MYPEHLRDALKNAPKTPMRKFRLAMVFGKKIVTRDYSEDGSSCTELVAYWRRGVTYVVSASRVDRLPVKSNGAND